MKLRHLCASLLLILATSLCAFAQQGVTVSDVTGTSNIRFGVNKIIFPNGTVAISGRTATISGIGATFTNGSSISDTGSGVFLFGGAASATPHTQQFTMQNGVGSNIAGANFTLTGSIGTGTGVGGNLLGQVAYPGTTGSSLNTASTVFSVFGVNNQSSGTAIANALFTITPTVNQTSTAGYDAFLVNATETATGSGTKNLLDLAVASTSKFSVDDTGAVHFPNASVLSDTGAAAFTLGGAASATPTAQTLAAQAGVGTNIIGAPLTIAAGTSTGNAVPPTVNIATAALGGASGASATTNVSRFVIGASKIVTNNTVTSIQSCVAPSNASTAEVFDYTVEVFDATNVQVETGEYVCSVTNKAGAFTQGGTGGCTKFGNQQTVTSGTLTVTMTQTGANPALVQINANSSLSPSAGYPRVTYTLRDTANQVCTTQ